MKAFAVISIAGVILGSGLGTSSVSASESSHITERPSGITAWSRFDDFETGTARIVVADAHGHQVTPITHPPLGGQDIDPRFSPDGRHILFERDDATGTSFAGIIGTDGRGEGLIDLGCVDPCVATNTPTWTPDGHHLLYDRVSGPFDAEGNASSAALWKANLDGTEQHRVSDIQLDSVRTEETNASFAPSGYRVVLRDTTDRQSAVFREWADGSHAVQITPWGLLADLPFVSPARFGPTKDLVVFEATGFSAAPGSTAGARIGTVPANCTSLANCTAQIRYLSPAGSPANDNFNPSWSPDGKRVIYVHHESGSTSQTPVGDIWTMRWDGLWKTPLSQDPRFEYRPAWAMQQDGR